MESNSMVTMSRDCEVTQIPSGMKMNLPAGSKVRITQSLGGSYTLMTEQGYMVRLADKDLDAIGKAKSQENSQSALDADTSSATKESVEKAVWEQLKTCYDPEIPVNIVELGLIYDCQVAALEAGGFKVHIKMTLTAPGCGMGASIASDAESKILRIAGVKDARVELVWIPPWDPSKMSEAAKLQLGMM